MKKLIDTLKDYLYEAADFIIILIVIFSVGAIIGWRIPVLFTSNINKTYDKEIVEAGKEDQQKEISDNENTDDKEDTNEENNNNDESSEDSKETETNNDKKEDNSNDSNEDDSNEDDKSEENSTDGGKIITVEIPKGSLSPDIAGILLNLGLIENKSDFTIKAEELELDRALKYGTYKIKTSSSLEDIIRQIAGQKR